MPATDANQTAGGFPNPANQGSRPVSWGQEQQQAAGNQSHTKQTWHKTDMTELQKGREYKLSGETNQRVLVEMSLLSVIKKHI